MRTARVLFPIVFVILTVSCRPPAEVDHRAADAAALQKADEEWSATAGKHDVEGTVAFYADDAVVLPPNEPMAVDAKTIDQVWSSLLGPNTALSWKASKAEVAKSGDLGYVYGTYEFSMKDPKGGPIHDTGKFAEIWRKQPDGRWKCIVDTYNSDLPVPAPPEKKK